MNTNKNRLRHDESRRDSIIQPRVARNELPWVRAATKSNPERVESGIRQLEFKPHVCPLSVVEIV
jgi:hypothetical protein